MNSTSEVARALIPAYLNTLPLCQDHLLFSLKLARASFYYVQPKKILTMAIQPRVEHIISGYSALVNSSFPATIITTKMGTLFDLF